MDHPYRILIIGGSGSGKTNMLFNLIKHQRRDIDKIYSYVNIHSNQRTNCLLMEEKKVGIKTLKNPKAFISYSQKVDDVYENLEDYSPTKKRIVLRRQEIYSLIIN